MGVVLPARLRLASAGAAFAIAGSALLASGAGAQAPPSTPPPGSSGGFVIACVAPAGSPPGGSPAPFTMAAGAAPTQAVRIDLAEELARVLGKPKAEIERAIEQVHRDMPPTDQIVSIGVTFQAGTIEEVLGPVAARLGVTAAELEEALTAAAPPCPTTPPTAGPAQAIRLDPSAHFAAVAAKLGRGITGQQVQAAFEASRPTVTPTSVATFAIEPGAFVEALARALGVSVEQLRSALASIRPGGAPARP